MILKPTHRAVIDVGHFCNLRCKMCYHKHELESASFESTDVLKGQILAAKNRGNNYLDFTGGAPELHPGIIDIVKYADSLGMKSCIITAGIIGQNHTANLLAAGVDDFLISVHGTAETCNDIMRLKGGSKFNARERQERFINQLISAGKDFRFNMCMLRQNQEDVISTAKWMVQWKPRIVNFISMNPHHGWQGDVEGTKKVIADLDILEAQLSQAIPILLDAGIGVNVRYYPMCRLPEAFRMHVCNDYHVLFDPFEWDYNITPKTFQKYYSSAIAMSQSVEWKGQPCQQCDAKYICGGPNAAFYRASDMKGVAPIKDPNLPRDDFYHYRRQNVACLTPRVPYENTMCIAAFADERYRAYVPIFLYCAIKAYPEYDIKVFTTYSNHEDVKRLVDRSVGYGVYDSCVVRSENVSAQYASNSAVSAAMRFVEFEDQLSEYDNVLWTDIDIMLFPDGDLIKKHRDQMKKDGTECYESFMPITPAEDRVCAVLFVIKEWWEKTRSAREDAKKWLMESISTKPTIDEEMLFRIIAQSGLPVPPRDFRNHRHHGNHFGDWRFWRTKRIAPNHLSKECEDNILLLVKDEKFMNLQRQCGSISSEISELVSDLEVYIRSKVETISKGCISVPEKKIILPAKKSPFEHYEGSFIIFTVVDEAYQWYIPMFARSLELAYPGQMSTVLIRNGSAIDIKNILSTFKNFCTVEMTQDDDLPLSGWTTAAYRFLSPTNSVCSSDFCLITDIDIMFMPESVSIVDQHMRSLKAEGMQCYDNMISQRRGDEIRMPGVHFVTKEWWDRTKEQRKNEYDTLLKTGATEYCYDEFMLGRIVKNSGLNLPSNPLRLQWQHGIHLGDWRLNMAKKLKVFSNVFQKMHMATLLKDEVWMSLLSSASKKIQWLSKLKKEWENELQ